MQKHFKLYNSIVKYLAVAILVVIPLYPKFPLFRVPGSYVSIRLEDLLILSSLIVALVYILPRYRFFLKNKVFRTIVLFLAAGFVSVFCAIFVTRTVVASTAILHLLRRFEYFVPLFVAYIAIRNDKANADFFLKSIFVTVFLVFIYGLGQRYLSWPIIITQNEEYAKGLALRWTSGSHINSTFAGHYDLATFLVLVLPMVVSSFVLFKDKFLKFLTFFIYLMGMWLVSESASRISIVSSVLSVTVTLIFLKKFKYIPVIIILALLFATLSGNLLSRYRRLIDVVKIRIDKITQNSLAVSVYAQGTDDVSKEFSLASPTPTSIPVFEDRSTSIRFNVEWPRALRAFEKNPIVGTGYSSITLATDNDFLRLLGEVGIVGFVSFFLIFLRLVIKVFEFLPGKSYTFSKVELVFVSGLIGGTFGVFANAFFIDIFEASKFAMIFWFLIGVLLAIYEDKN
jgi:hypothetical protein